MLNDKVEIEVYGRKFIVEMEGLSQLEISALANRVDTLMHEIAKETKIVDSSKLAILTAIEISGELQRLSQRVEDLDKAEGRQVDGMILDLEKTIETE